MSLTQGPDLHQRNAARMANEATLNGGLRSLWRPTMLHWQFR